MVEATPTRRSPVPGYMAPEQYTMDAEIDARADVFAFCATLYRALYGTSSPSGPCERGWRSTRVTACARS